MPCLAAVVSLQGVQPAFLSRTLSCMVTVRASVPAVAAWYHPIAAASSASSALPGREILCTYIRGTIHSAVIEIDNYCIIRRHSHVLHTSTCCHTRQRFIFCVDSASNLGHLFFPPRSPFPARRRLLMVECSEMPLSLLYLLISSLSRFVVALRSSSTGLRVLFTCGRLTRGHRWGVTGFPENVPESSATTSAVFSAALPAEAGCAAGLLTSNATAARLPSLSCRCCTNFLGYIIHRRLRSCR